MLDLKECHLHAKVSEEIRKAVKYYTMQAQLSFYNFKKKGFLKNLMIHHTSIGEVMTLLQFLNENKEKREALLCFFKTKIS